MLLIPYLSSCDLLGKSISRDEKTKKKTRLERGEVEEETKSTCTYDDERTLLPFSKRTFFLLIEFGKFSAQTSETLDCHTQSI